MGDLKSIYDWYNENVEENQMRTCLTPGHPASQGKGLYPPSYFTPISATAALSFDKLDLNNRPKRKRPAKKKATKKKPGKKK